MRPTADGHSGLDYALMPAAEDDTIVTCCNIMPAPLVVISGNVKHTGSDIASMDRVA